MTVEPSGTDHDVSPADELEVHRLLARYNQAMDIGTPDEWTSCYTPDGTFTVQYAEPRVISGRDELLAMCRETQSKYRMRHYSSNVVVAKDGSDLQVKSYMTVTDLDHANAVLLTGVMQDRIVRHEGRWRIRDRWLFPDDPTEER